MYIDLPTNGNVTEASTPYGEQFSSETANHEKVQLTTLVPFVREPTKPRVSYLPTTPKPSSNTLGFAPKTEIWPSLATEAPESTKTHNPLYNGILGGVLVVVIVWVVVMIIFFRNKLLARKQRRRERSPPPYSSSTQTDFDSSSLRTETNSQFGLLWQSQSSIVDVGTNMELQSSFVILQPTAPDAAATSPSFINEDPPSYAEIHHHNTNGIKPNLEEQPPSYIEAQQQRIKIERRS